MATTKMKLVNDVGQGAAVAGRSSTVRQIETILRPILTRFWQKTCHVCRVRFFEWLNSWKFHEIVRTLNIWRKKRVIGV